MLKSITMLPRGQATLRLSLLRKISTTSPIILELTDTVSIKNLKFRSRVNNEVKDLQASVDLKTSFQKASATDDLKYSINYAVLSRAIKDYTSETLSQGDNFKDLATLSSSLFQKVLFHENCTLGSLKVTEKKDNCEIIYHLNRYNNEQDKTQPEKIDEISDKILINDLQMMTIIGVFKEERLDKQPVILNIELETPDLVKDSVDSNHVAKLVNDYVEKSEFKTVEALVLNVSKLILSSCENVKDCKVQVWKPTAIEYTDGVGVSIIRNREAADIASLDFVKFDQAGYIPNLNSETTADSNGSIETTGKSPKEHTVYIAFGSNQGDQLANINESISLLEKLDIKVLRTSSLYRSKPMYFLDQPSFINGVLKCSTTESPQGLLKKLKQIEYEFLNRVKEFNNGPRSIDLDIILYDNVIVNDKDLNVPHISMLERSFVLVPLCELISPEFIHPVTAEPIHNHLKQLFANVSGLDKEIQESIDLINIVPLRGENVIDSEKCLEFDLINNKNDKINTKLMGILNVTPDSFSDGGDFVDLTSIEKRIQQMVDSKIEIIDIGGCSTRPNSEQVDGAEEMNRILPIIELIKKKYPQILVSVDTYRSKVAEEAILAGADIINDISGGQFDDKMFEIVAKYKVPYVLSHTRGDINTMTKLTDYSQDKPENSKEFYTVQKKERNSVPSDTILNISRELSILLNKALDAGIARWQLILDPGLGFAKNTKQNIDIIKDLPILKGYMNSDKSSSEVTTFKGLPVLMGHSRKRFLGEIMDVTDAKDRIPGTLACIMPLVENECDIIRLHDFKEGKEVVKLADYIYKNNS